MALGSDKLWSHVLRRATETVGLLTLFVRLNALFTQSEVRDLQVALRVKQHVFWLQVAINNAVLVETVEAAH